LFSLNLFLKWVAAFLRILRLFKKFRDSGMPIKVGRHTAGHGHSEMDAEISADQCMRVRIKFMNYWIYENMNITYAPRPPSRSHRRQNYLRQTKTEDNRTGRTYSYAEKNRRGGGGLVGVVVGVRVLKYAQNFIKTFVRSTFSYPAKRQLWLP